VPFTSCHGWQTIQLLNAQQVTDIWPFLEPMTGIEPAYSAWEADVLPLNYIGDAAWEG
jgi:hypothetical protein